MTQRVVVLDLDGVVLQSNQVKRRAMLKLFAGHPEQIGAIAAYVGANPGVRRDDKIRHILGRILEASSGPQVVADHLARYEQLLGDELATAPLVPGIDVFLTERAHVFYVSSSAPESEVVAQLTRRSLGQRFTAVFGASTPKAHALRRVSERHRNDAVIFFGDAVSDFEAARAAGTAFVGVISEDDTFGDLAITKIVDFTDPSAVRASMESALRERQHRP
jgi:phosphoglycolate phosphatase-like HAD superfamily hydrolase